MLKMFYTKNKAFGLAWVEKSIEAELIQGNRKFMRILVLYKLLQKVTTKNILVITFFGFSFFGFSLHTGRLTLGKPLKGYFCY
jgi:hypothetical protein